MVQSAALTEQRSLVRAQYVPLDFVRMADVYILYSRTLSRYYIGSCVNVDFRIQQHLQEPIPGSFTSKAKDWEIYLTITGLGFKQARAIESHIKKMKSKRYIQNLKRYPEIIQRLISSYRFDER